MMRLDPLGIAFMVAMAALALALAVGAWKARRRVVTLQIGTRIKVLGFRGYVTGTTFEYWGGQTGTGVIQFSQEDPRNQVIP